MGTRAIVTCSRCGRELPLLSAFIPGEDFRQWFGNACSSCGGVYCSQCITVGGPTPCPGCGEPTQAAQLAVLRDAGVIGTR